MRAARVIFKGKVQGVWFRANCMKKAVEMNLSGWVRNLTDGNVEALVSGEEEAVERFIEWNEKHQPYARVDEASVEWLECNDRTNGFVIRR